MLDGAVCSLVDDRHRQNNLVEHIEDFGMFKKGVMTFHCFVSAFFRNNIDAVINWLDFPPPPLAVCRFQTFYRLADGATYQLQVSMLYTR